MKLKAKAEDTRFRFNYIRFARCDWIFCKDNKMICNVRGDIKTFLRGVHHGPFRFLCNIRYV